MSYFEALISVISSHGLKARVICLIHIAKANIKYILWCLLLVLHLLTSLTALWPPAQFLTYHCQNLSLNKQTMLLTGIITCLLLAASYPK